MTMQVIITPRLMPGFQLGNAFVSIEPTNMTDGYGKPYWNWYIDIDSTEYRGDDLSGWDDAEGMLESLVAFLYATGEAYAYHGGMYEDSSTDLFPEPVCRWADMYQDDLSMLCEEEEG